MRTLESGRIGIGALALGIARAAYERAVRYATERETFGRKLGGHQTIQAYLADMLAELEAARLLVYRAAFMRNDDVEFGREAAIAKMYASEVAMRVTERAIQIHGGFGYVREFEVERYWRDAKLTTIGEGATEICQLVIARNILEDAARG
jgi:alkylation response protein AidB-like acyl-CoA dehydrogenase